MITAIIIIVVVLLLVGVVVGMYNGLIKLRNLVQEAWRQIDVELTRRHDLIGNLVETVKGYAATSGASSRTSSRPAARPWPPTRVRRSRPRARTC